MIDYLGYIAIRCLSFFFCVLPLRIGLFAGRCLGRVAYLFSGKRRRIAYANLKAAFSKEKAPSEIKDIVKGLYRNLGQIFIEVLRFPVADKRYIKKFITLDGLQRLEAAKEKGKGIIAVTAHFGNWELSSLFGGLSGFTLSVLAREQKHTRLNELLNQYRQMAGCRVIKKGISTRQLVKALRDNEIIGILADQDAGKLGQFVDFFGRPASTHSGAFVFAQKTGADVIPAFMVRQKGPYHKIEVLEPIRLESGMDPEEALRSGLRQFSNILEGYVRRYPSQWLWVHKRWKSTPVRYIAVLNDGKTGHLNQSMAVAKIIQKHRQDKGYSAIDTKIEVLDVEYKDNFRKALLGICGNFASSSCQGCMRCVKFCLKEKSYKPLIGAYADIVVSCGSSLAAVNVFLAKELNARNIVIMKPGLVGLKKFSLAIIPAHDSPAPQRNILKTIGAPNMITGEALEAAAQRFSSFVKLANPIRLGVFLGGDNADYKMSLALAKDVLGGIKAASEKFNLDILATTSRRTPKEVAEFLKKELAGFPNCRLFIVAHEKNIEGAVPAILGLSNIVLVSGESISMISEAASSGRAVLVFPLEKKNDKKTRHDMMVKELEMSGIIRVADSGDVASAIKEALDFRNPPKRLGDYDKIYNAVGGLL